MKELVDAMDAVEAYGVTPAVKDDCAGRLAFRYWFVLVRL